MDNPLRLVSAYGFTDEQQDSTPGLVHLRVRTYNPNTGHSQSVQTDPVLGTPTQPRPLHNYAYAFNNLVNLLILSARCRQAHTSPAGVYVRLPDVSYASPPPTQQAYAYNPPRRSGPTYPLTPVTAQRSANQDNWQSQSDPSSSMCCGVFATSASRLSIMPRAWSKTRKRSSNVPVIWSACL